jgi:beta-glucosidase
MKATKNYRLSYTRKAEELVRQMTLEEKIYLMSGRVTAGDIMSDIMKGGHYNSYPYPAGGNERLGIPEMKFCDGPRGAVQGSSTCFPVTMARGATFDPDLEERIGIAIGKEIRAHGGNLFGGVCVNLPYNPGWGRSQETYGEESYHIGLMGSALVRGIQKENVIACVKHYAFNSMENSRFRVNVKAGKRTEREIYLAHFEDCIRAGAASIMSAYNIYQGEFCGHHDYLLNKVLKGEWEFDGFVISDFIMGIRDTVSAANGGMDIEMCHTYHYGSKLVEAVKDGRVSERKIDEAALRIVRTLIAFTESDDIGYPSELIGSQEHISLAREAAEKSLTLLKNDNNTLPFPGNIKKLAVIGKLGNQDNIGDHGSSRVFPEYIVTPCEGIIREMRGAEVIFYDGEDPGKARELAASVDYVVFVAGYGPYDEGEYTNMDEMMNLEGVSSPADIPEGADLEAMASQLGEGGDRRRSLGLHAGDIELIRTSGPANSNSVVVLIGGNMIMIEEWKDSVSAIIMAYYPGMEGGTAIAGALSGRVNPGGKLPFVVPLREEDLPQVDWDTTEQYYSYYHGYAKLEKEGIEPCLPYGFGLSYTTFKLSNPEFLAGDKKVTASCDVENSGKRTGDEVVQMYIGFRNSSVDRPVKLLRGFKRVTLEPGAKRRVTISCPVEKLRWFNPETDRWELEHMDYQVYIGNSSSDKNLLEGTVTI